MRYIPRHFRSDWERGYEAGSRHMQEIQHAEVRTTAEVERGLRDARGHAAAKGRGKRFVA